MTLELKAIFDDCSTYFGSVVGIKYILSSFGYSGMHFYQGRKMDAFSIGYSKTQA